MKIRLMNNKRRFNPSPVAGGEDDSSVNGSQDSVVKSQSLQQHIRFGCKSKTWCKSVWLCANRYGYAGGEKTLIWSTIQ